VIPLDVLWTAPPEGGAGGGLARRREDFLDEIARELFSRVPLDTILSALKTHPGMVQHLEGIDVDGDKVPDMPPGPPPMDPMGRLQWQNMMAQRQQMMRMAQQRRAQRKAVNNQTMLAHLQAHDPIFELVHHKVGEFLRLLPVKLQRPLLYALEGTPGAYLDLYTEMRGVLLHHGEASGSVRAPAQPPSRSEDPRAAVRRAVAGRMSPPALERAGILDDRLPGASRAAELAALKARCKAGKAREGDLLRYIELSMPEIREG